MGNRIFLSVVIPVFNEESILLPALRDLITGLDELLERGSWEILPVNNGSSDKTPSILSKLAEEYSDVRPIQLERPNIGHAMRTGIYAATGEWVYIMPLDEGEIPFLKWAWSHRDSYDLIVGSKRADPSLNQQTSYRRLLSWGLNGLLCLLTDYAGTDTHGQKLLRMKEVRAIVDRSVMKGGLFDSEITIRSFRAGLRMAEIPVEYSERRPARNLMIKKIGRNIRDVWRLRWALRNEPFHGPARYHRWAREDVLNCSLPSLDSRNKNSEKK